MRLVEMTKKDLQICLCYLLISMPFRGHVLQRFDSLRNASLLALDDVYTQLLEMKPIHPEIRLYGMFIEDVYSTENRGILVVRFKVLDVWLTVLSFFGTNDLHELMCFARGHFPRYVSNPNVIALKYEPQLRFRLLFSRQAPCTSPPAFTFRVSIHSAVDEIRDSARGARLSSAVALCLRLVYSPLITELYLSDESIIQ